MKPGLHVYTVFDSIVVLQDTVNTLLSRELGQSELQRIDTLPYLPEATVGRVSRRKAEDMKWGHIRKSIKEAADILADITLDPGFKKFHCYCHDNKIPITVVSM